MMKAISAGFIIGLGYICYLYSETKIFGLLLFSLGLTSICVLELKLCTGQAGKRLHSKFRKDWLALLEIWFLNIGGACLAFILFVCSRFGTDTIENFALIAAQKTDRSLVSILFSAILCGILIQIAISWWKKQSGIVSLFGVVLCVFTFASMGFDHCIVNSLFIGYKGGIILTLISTIGNMIGGYLAYEALEVKTYD